MFDFSSVKEVQLSKGAHSSPEKGMCFMEMAAWFAGEEHSDKPACVSPSLGMLGIAINDCMEAEVRDRSLKPMIPLVVGTYDEEAERSRIEYICLRAFNYAFGILFPEFARRVRGGARSVRDARQMAGWLRDYRRYDQHGGHTGDIIMALKYSMAEVSADPIHRRLASALEEMLAMRLPMPRFEAVQNLSECTAVYCDRDTLTVENAKAAAGVFSYVAEIIPDWSAALDTLREAIRLGRHDGFTATINLQARHERLRELVTA